MTTPVAALSAQRLRVRAMTRLTPQVLSVVLESLDQTPLTSAQPGDHIDLQLARGLTRSYSIVGQAGAPSRYEIAVALEDRKSVV